MSGRSAGIIVFAVYFGRLPDYFPLWLQSCRFNPQVTWQVVTDADTSAYDAPNNVEFRRMTMPDFCALMSGAAGVPVHFEHAYKACDFRPLYSALLDPARHWDFWGHCDLDMLFGDLGRYLTPDLLARYDKIFSVGHFTLYRNEDATNAYYRKPHPELDWRTILTDPAHRAFDEHMGVNRIWTLHGGRFHTDESVVADISPNIRRLERSSNYFKFPNYLYQVFCFDQGHVRRLFWKDGRMQSEEFMYIHFQKRKMALDASALLTDRFFVTPQGFVPMGATPPTLADLKRLNGRPLVPSRRELLYRLRRELRFARAHFKTQKV